ncbi:septal ring lytic transglycosylase RlpA family protein [Pontibacter sp. SGAir0037]|uniref:septal ring lytic transglycosylase RlpA family protein n=1 Tax=Pontibacter sp. SGAir0037 TaxID=2571030 RepID=UPI0010CD42A7|nr:septal ring lytic transglycosylase RlpA family protein [Pontibacter sp. SGAir0037]QCR23886.1 septal ring lytic transglycosylase RlpA family lipoprotein [Pontibacter sp. SGAir0037]
MNHDRKCLIYLVIIFLFFGFSPSAFSQDDSQTQEGTASWYGSQYHGRPTSSGERYNKNDMTAAHNGLPFGTKVKVTNLTNNKSVVLRINDRGPFRGSRIIDVSEAAAKKLDFRNNGLSDVKVEVIEWPYDMADASSATEKSDNYIIKTGSFAKPEYALELKQKLKAFDRHLKVELVEESVKGRRVHRIKAGNFDNKQEAEAFNELLAEEGLNGVVMGV